MLVLSQRFGTKALLGNCVFVYLCLYLYFYLCLYLYFYLCLYLYILSQRLLVLQHFCVMTQQMETDIHLHHDYRCSLFIKEKKCKGTFRIFKLGLFCFISLFAITVTIYRLSYDNILQAICGL